MRRFILSVLITLLMFIAGMSISAPATYAANTPPGPTSANPAVQPDGILVPDVFGSTPNWNLTPPLRKFIDSLAPLGCNTPNNLGQCIPIAVPDTLTFPGSDYYEIELQRYTEKVHTDLPLPTTFQGYKQVNNGTNAAGTTNNVTPPAVHYLGPLILTQKGRPVRIKFVNKLPLEAVEPFFLPVDRTVMGAGMGTKNADGSDCDPVWDPRGRGLPTTEPNCANYTTNRAELHLHGGLNPWISDGTPHQWITPAGENTPYKKADNVQYVPDMWFNASGSIIASCAGQLTCGATGASNNPGDGAQTYYYTNDQSARLMFYHDHSYGITRLNVYAGEAAGYMIQDPTELDLINRGIIPADQIPLIIQDKAFVDPATIGTLDPTWVWGTGAALPIKWIDDIGTPITSCAGLATCNVPNARKIIGRNPKAGDLWWPHVYMPAENPSALGGVNPMGRWVYGLYFWPPTTGIKFLPVNNPYYDCNPLGICNAPWEPPTMPATINPSWTAEAFVDTPMINGTVYPKLTVQPKSYRLRILNAAHDRFFNLQLYEADATVDPNVVNPACANFVGGCATNTEVKMVPAIIYPAFPLWDPAADQREGGVPDPAKSGPAWIQIGNEGGFLPAPVVIPNQPISFVLDPTLFNVGDVNDGTIIMGPAERADVIIDFSQYAGKTLILYNDAPAAFPAFVPNNDYYTNNPDNTGAGGHPGTKAGIGPNTRTLMQINVAASTPAPAFNLNQLMNEFTTTPTQDGVFKKSQHPVIVGQSAYDSAYNYVFPAVAPFWGISNIGDQKISFASLNPTTLTPEIVNSYPMQPKALHDEMGAVWDEYGRMSAKLGVELPNTTNINQIFVMQNYVDPPTENVQDGKVQIWKLTHNGVDTHPLHFHLFDVQVINRVGWDGFVRLPWPNELGWKETVRVSPLEDTIVAMRPKAPPVPFPLMDSVHLKNPVFPVGATDGFMNLEPLTGQAKVPAETNTLYNYGAEYVWHCHILSHEEQDMMRPLVLRVATGAPADPSGLTVFAGLQRNDLSWTDNSYDGTITKPYDMTLGFYIERCNGACNANTGTFTRIADMSMISSSSPTYIDDTVTPGATYTYRVIGYNRYTTNGTAAGSWFNGFSAPAYSASVVSQSWTPASTLTLTGDFASPHDAPVKFIALAGGTAVQPQYRFSVNNTVVQDYSVTRYWVMPAGTTPATYSVKVDARTNYASATPDISQTILYDLLPTIDSTAPITTAIPAAGDFINPVQVYLQVNEASSIIRYTIDGSTPTSTNGTIYAGPISISATTTLKYFATDPAGNPEAVQIGQYNLLPMNLNANVFINGGATVTGTPNVTLSISALGATKMRFSNDGITYTADENFATTRAWTLAPPTPDGQRFVYVRFTASNGVLQSPVTASITLDTTAPATTASPAAPATFIAPVNVALTSSEPAATIRYTTDGSNPVTSATAAIYTTAIPITATTQINYYATDPAGNMEAIKSGIYTIHTGDLIVQTFTINGGATLTNNPNVTLAIAATDATSVVKMRFSNDGVTYSADEPYATAKNWVLSAGDGVKTIFVRFTDGAGILYNPVTAQITLHTALPVITTTPPPGTYVNSVNIFLTADEPASVIKYTFDGSDPRTSATAATYAGPFNINATTSINYSATDPAGNTSAPVTALYSISTANIAASVIINNGATLTNSQLANLTVSATGAAMMSFSNDGINYSVAEPYATTKNWMLGPLDGIKAVFVRFTDAAGQVYAPVTSQITLDTTIPVTSANPPTGAFVSSINVYLTANETGSIILYTLDGSDPATSATAAVYSGPITISSTTTLRYFATDQAGNAETAKLSSYTITSSVIAATLSINGGAALTNNQSASLAISANSVDMMSFSNDGITYSAQEAYATSKTWLLSAGDGNKTIFVKFFDTIHNLAYDPITAQIALDTSKPVTSAVPATGTFVSSVNVSLAVNEQGSTIRYTVDGSDPSISPTAIVYSGLITVSTTSTIRYFATDPAGNAETPLSDTYTITSSVITAAVAINGGVAVTANQNVTLSIAAVGVDTMSFSNNGITYSAQEAYATNKLWSLNPGDGIKTMYVKFYNTALNIAYDPVTAQITLDTTAPVTTALPASATFISNVTVTLASNEPGSTIKYTLDGTDPATSATAVIYNGSILLNTTTPVRYFATDQAGNIEVAKASLYTITSSVLAASVSINGGAAYASNPNVNLSIAATGVNMMSLSNNGVTYSAQEAYATNKAWSLSSGDGAKTVYIKFYDTANNISYDPVIAQISLDTLKPVTSVVPATGTFISLVNVSLSANEPGSTIRYTVDGSDPSISTTALIYTGPITVSATTTIRYFATDLAGNAEVPLSSTYTITSSIISASVAINGGAAVTANQNVNLTIVASGVDMMSFSNNGITYSIQEAYSANKLWSLNPGDGPKTIYVKFYNSAQKIAYDPVTAQITLDTTKPVTAAIPAPATFISSVMVTLTANEPGSRIMYTTDGSDPATSASAVTYNGSISLSTTTSIRYFATDPAGNIETPKTGLYTITSSVLVSSVSINGGAAYTNNPSVDLGIAATGVNMMSFSNNGVTYSAQETYAISKVWKLSNGDGVKTVYVKFFDTTNNISYDPVIAQIALDTATPVTSALPATGTFISSINISLSANEPSSTIRYTLDGSDPSVSSTALTYTNPVAVSTTTTIRYFATDLAGNRELPLSGTYTITSPIIPATVAITGGATVTSSQNVNLTIAASGVDMMSFSNNGITYSIQEAYAANKLWSLSPGDGPKTVYVKFYNTAQNIAYDPVTTQITLDTTRPVTTAIPAPATFISNVVVTLTANEPGSKITYTTDGSDPATSATTVTYSGSFNLTTTTPIRYFATDSAGNAEAPKSALYTITSSVIAASVSINGGAAYSNSPSVNLGIAATGVNMMSFSNNGITYSAQETYATNKVWTLSSGDGVKTVYVKFFDTTNNISYDPVIAKVIFDTSAPITTTMPAAGVFINTVSVALTSSEPGSTTQYTLDGSDPAISATAATYSAPLSIAATTTIRYFTVDVAGNAEAVKSGTYTINSSTINASVVINGGATITGNGTVNLAIAATGVNKMSFSNDGITYTVPETYASTKTWTVSAGDGAKTVFVRLQNSTNNPVLTYDPVTAQITLDTSPPVTAVSPVPGTFISQATVTLFANESGSSIKYTLDGSDPATSATAAVYSAPVPVSATTTLRYFATDVAGNAETAKSGTYTIISSTINASVAINGGASVTGNSTVNLALSANNVDKMSFSNDGITYSTPETYAASKAWTVPSGDGVKTVFVRFQNSTNNPVLTYDPVTAQIILDTTAPVSNASPAPAVFLGQVNVTLSSTEQGSTIRYTLDNSDPATSTTAATYTAPLIISATTTVRYFSSDAAGNAETAKSGTYTIHTGDLTVDTFNINNGAATTTTPNVTLAISATDAMGVISMRFSNDGVNYSADEPYAISKSWTLAAGEGVKTVFVRFTDGAPNLYDPVTAQIILDTVAPATSIAPAPGVFISTVSATLTANESASTIKYTLDGSDPTTSASATTYTAPITVNATATIRYFARDVAGNQEAVKSSTYTIHTGDLTVNSFLVNNGASATNTSSVTLSIDASDAFGVSKMRFSNDGISYTADEPYATSKSWTLSSGDGVKTVYAQFTDGAGILYDPVTTQIKLDTLAAATSTNPPSGYSSMTPFPVTLTAADGTGAGVSSVVYTIDGSDPLTSATAVTYSAPILINYDTVLTIRYFATDNAGNKEPVQSATFKVTHEGDMQASVTINSGSTVTITPSITLTIAATDSVGVASMSFSNDGSNYSANETYATTKAWMLPGGEGQKTVYVKFIDNSGNTYGPYTAQIALAFKDGLIPGTTSQLASAMKALQIAKGTVTATDVDLAHADVAPFVNGVPQPDGKIDLLDVYVLLLHLVGVVEL